MKNLPMFTLLGSKDNSGQVFNSEDKTQNYQDNMLPSWTSFNTTLYICGRLGISKMFKETVVIILNI